MGFTNIKVEVCNPTDLSRCQEVEVLVDTGAMLSIVPRPVLEKLGVVPAERRRFRSFDGRVVTRWVGTATFRYGGHTAGASVVFGEPRHLSVLGVTALEALGYQVDPVSNQLRPIELLMASSFPAPLRRRTGRR